MKSTFLVLVAALQLTPAFGADQPSRQSASAASPDTTNIERFVPVDWVVTQSVEGDLNADSIPDLAAVLLRDDAGDGNPTEQSGSRGLLVLFADPSGGYHFQDFAPDALPCVSCLGDPDGDPKASELQLAIAAQRLTVGWQRFVPDMTKIKLIIGYDSKRGALRLLADETLTRDSGSGKSSRRVRDYVAGTMTSGDHKENIPSRFIPLVDVSAEDY